MARRMIRPIKIREDDATTETLIQMGYIVIRFHYDDDWLAIFLPPRRCLRNGRTSDQCGSSIVRPVKRGTTIACLGRTGRRCIARQGEPPMAVVSPPIGF